MVLPDTLRPLARLPPSTSCLTANPWLLALLALLRSTTLTCQAAAAGRMLVLRRPTSLVSTILVRCFSPMPLSSLLVPIPTSTSTRPRSSPPLTPPRSFTHLTSPPPSVQNPPAYLPPSRTVVHTLTSLFLPPHTPVPRTLQLLIPQSFLPVAASLPMP